MVVHQLEGRVSMLDTGITLVRIIVEMVNYFVEQLKFQNESKSPFHSAQKHTLCLQNTSQNAACTMVGSRW